MTQREFLKFELLKLLKPRLEKFGFKLNKNQSEFTKKTSLGWFKFQIVFLLIDSGWDIKPGLLVRFNSVEDIFHQISGFEKKFQRGTPTIGTSIENYLQNDLTSRFTLNVENELNEIADNLYNLFMNIGFTFFEKFKKLENVDVALNSNPQDTSLTGDIFKGSKSLIVAKLVDNKKYDMLKGIYFDHYTKFSDGFYLPEFNKLVLLLSKSNSFLNF